MHLQATQKGMSTTFTEKEEGTDFGFWYNETLKICFKVYICN